MGQDIYSMTPGSAVAGQLQEILARKKLEARQAMLDSLHTKNVESEISARNENAATMKENRESMAQNRSAQELIRRASLYSPHMNLPDGSDKEFFKREAPSLIDPGQKGTAPLGPQDLGPEMPSTPDKFHGLPAQLEIERKNNVQAQATAKLLAPGFKDLSVPEQAYWYEQATGHQPSAGIIDPKSDQEVPVYDANGKPTGQKAPANAKFLTREPREPRAPDPTPLAFTGTNEAGEDVPFLTDHKGGSIPVRVPPGLKFAGRIGTDRPAAAQHITTADVNSMKTAVTKRNDAKDKGGWWGKNEALDAAEQNLVAIQSLMISKLPQDLQPYVQKMVENKVQSTTTDLIEGLKAYRATHGKPLTADQLASLQSNLPTILGRF